MNEDTSTRCSKCHKPHKSTGSGFITQFLEVCVCNTALSASNQAEVISLCATCGKRIGAGREGSFTQYIFRSELCSCENPKPFHPTAAPGKISFSRRVAEDLTELETIPEDEAEIAVDADKFPLQRYRPTAILGSGASGTVYLCTDRLLNKRVAVKILHHLSAEQLISFQDEARLTSQLNHPNIVRK